MVSKAEQATRRNLAQLGRELMPAFVAAWADAARQGKMERVPEWARDYARAEAAAGPPSYSTGPWSGVKDEPKPKYKETA